MASLKKKRKSKDRRKKKKVSWRVLIVCVIVAVVVIELILMNAQKKPPTILLKESSSFGINGRGAGQFSRPSGLALDNEDNIYISDSGNKRVQIFDPKGKFIKSLDNRLPPLSLQEPQGIGVTKEKRVAFLDPPTGVLYIVSLDGAPGRMVKSYKIPDSYYPRGLFLDSQEGILYVADTGEGRVVKCNLNGEILNRFGKHGSSKGQFSDPQGLTVDGDGNIYIADTGNFRIQKMDREGHVVSQWRIRARGDTPRMVPFSLVIDRNGRVVVSDPQNSVLWLFSKQGDILGKLINNTGSLASPTGIAVDKAGFIVVANQGSGKIVKFEPIP